MKKLLIAMTALLMVFAFASCENSASAPAVAEIKWVDNMMGSASTEGTQTGNFATSDAMEEGATIDSDGAIHATFKPIDNSKFTAYTTGATGYGYYARYNLNIPALTAKDADDPATEGDDREGTFLVYTIEYGNGDKVYGASNSRAKCTKVGEYKANETPEITITYYVVEGTYARVTNTPYVDTLPEPYKSLVDDATNTITITLGSDCVFNEPAN